MPFDPEMLIPIVLFTFLFLLASRAIKFKHERRKWEAMKGQGEGERSLTTSELQGMIEDAVTRATTDLEDRLELLEQTALPMEADEGLRHVGAREASKTVGRRRDGS